MISLHRGTLRRWPHRNSARTRAEACHRPGARFRPCVDLMEDRTLLSTLWVSNTNNSGAGSLRAAIVQANEAPEADTIDFAPGVTGTISLRSELRITADVTIDGPGADKLTLSGSGKSRVLHIIGDLGDHPPIVATLDGLTIANGAAPTGGGILNEDAALTVKHSVVTQNTATDANGKITAGGGIANLGPGATLTIDASTVSDNTAGNGGGLYAAIRQHGDDTMAPTSPATRRVTGAASMRVTAAR